MEGPAKVHLERLLATREWPKTLCPSEVARALSTEELQQSGISHWKDLMPQLRQDVFILRDQSKLEILQRGEVIGMDVGMEDVTGPIRIRRKAT